MCIPYAGVAAPPPVTGLSLEPLVPASPSATQPAAQRRPVTGPPLSPAAPVLAAGLLAALLTFVVVALVGPPGPRDQQSLSLQRDGLLLSGPQVPEQVGPVRFGEQVRVLLFVRNPTSPSELDAWSRQLPGDVALTVVRPADPQAARLAEVVDLPEPNDGGPPAGYAVVDPDRQVRYSTLDPAWRRNAFEVATIAGAVR